MIQNPTVAAEISALMLDIGDRINRSLAAAKTRLSAEEFERYRLACDMVLMDILMEIVSPIQDAHPELLAGPAAAEEEQGDFFVVDPPAHAPAGGTRRTRSRAPRPTARERGRL